MNFLKKLPNLNTLAYIAMAILALMMVFSVNDDAFWNMAIGLLALTAGGIFSANSMVAKAISIAMLLVSVALAGWVTEDRLNDLLVLSTWMPFFAGMLGGKITQLVNHYLSKSDESNTDEQSSGD